MLKIVSLKWQKGEIKMYDVIIIGSGPAGISAAIYLKRAKKKCFNNFKRK